MLTLCRGVCRVEMAPLFERYGQQLVDYWKKGLDESGSAVLPVAADLMRTVRIISMHIQYSPRPPVLRGPAVEYRSLAGVLSLSCAR